MRRFLIFSAILVTLYSVVFGAAAALNVDGGTLQVFAQAVALPDLRGTSLEAQLSAAGTLQQAEDGEHARVSGEVCVTNGGEQATQNLSITDLLQVQQGWGAYEQHASQPVDVSGRPVLGPGETYCYPYLLDFEPTQGAHYRNVALITISNHAGWLPGSKDCPGTEPCAFGPAPKASFELPDPEGCLRARLLADPQQKAQATPGGPGVYHWRLQNSGTCTWDGPFRIAFLSGDNLGAPKNFPLLGKGQAVEPGEEIEVAVAFQAPEGAGEYQGEFNLLRPDGKAVPVEGAPKDSLWLRVFVPPSDPTPTLPPLPTATGRATATTAPTAEPKLTPTPSPAATSTLPPTPTPPPADHGAPTQAPTQAGLRSCTRPAEFWLAHPQAWPVGKLSLGQRLYSKEQALEILLSETADPGYRLAQQLIAAKLNVEAGAKADSISRSIREADSWLAAHPLGSQGSASEAAALARKLEPFNLGQSGPGLCPDALLPPPPTSAPVFTATLSPTPTPSPSAPAPTASPAPTLPSGTPTPTLPAVTTAAPTSLPTASVTAQPASTETPTPTAEPTATPQPTDTPSAPTETPAPTSTATASVTPQPAPTHTPTASPTAPPALPTDTPTPEPAPLPETEATEALNPEARWQ